MPYTLCVTSYISINLQLGHFYEVSEVMKGSLTSAALSDSVPVHHVNNRSS